jgi:DNA-binding transcriptional LysR family regulator
MTQPALSRSVALLEEESGLLLFERTASGVVATPAGAELIREARRILGSVKLIENNLVLQGKGAIGRVSFAVGPVSANFLLARVLSQFLAEAPTVEANVVVRETSAIVEGVLEGLFDFGICTESTMSPAPGLVIEQIVTLRMGLFVRHCHPLLSAEHPINWEDLAGYPRATGRMPSHLRAVRDAFAPLDTTVECNDFEVLRHLTRSTDTIWLTAAEVVREELARGDFAELMQEEVSGRWQSQIVIVRQEGRNLGPAALHLIETIRAVAAA